MVHNKVNIISSITYFTLQKIALSFTHKFSTTSFFFLFFILQFIFLFFPYNSSFWVEPILILFLALFVTFCSKIAMTFNTNIRDMYNLTNPIIKKDSHLQGKKKKNFRGKKIKSLNTITRLGLFCLFGHNFCSLFLLSV